MSERWQRQSYPCALCGGTERRRLMRKAGVLVTETFDVVVCRSCGHVRVDPRIPDEQLDDLYDDAYYAGRGFDRTVDYDAPVREAGLRDVHAVIDTVAEARGGSLRGARWLDVGCGKGTLLTEAMRRGANVFGHDSSATAQRHCAKVGIPVLSSQELEVQAGTFDVVTAIEVIEHVPDPLGLLDSLRTSATIGGLVYVRTGNWNLVRRQPGTPYVMPEGHIQYFTPDCMRRLFAKASLGEVEVYNRTWFADRLLPSRVRSAAPPAALWRLASAARRFFPGFSQYPVGIRVR